MDKINSDKWDNFTIGDVYEIVERPQTRSQRHYDNGNVPYIASGSINNGVDDYLEPHSPKDIEKGKCLTISPVDASCFYQDKPFLGRGGGGSSILILRSSYDLTENQQLFLATVIQKKLQDLYTFNTMGNSSEVKSTKIKLPVDSFGTIDFEFMDDYISDIKSKANQRINLLKLI